MARYGKRVVITGLGAVTSLGLNVEDYWQSLCQGRSAGRTITHFDTEDISCKVSAPITDYDPLLHFNKKEARKNSLFVQYAVVASREALKNSGLEVTDENRRRIGAMIGSGIGGLRFMEEQHEILLTKGPKRVSPFLIPKMIGNMAVGVTSIDLGLQGPNSCVVTACASATHCLGDAMHIIKRGEADAMLAGGAESSITRLGIAGFNNMHALTKRNDTPQTASRPFDKGRDGFVMGEGAGIVVLESLDHAQARGANILAEITGYGMSADASHITAPALDGNGGARAMQAALDGAELNADAIDYINAHGTSTPLNDKTETTAIKSVFGDHAQKLAVSSTKSMIGHLLGAAGGVEAVACVKTLMHHIIPPTINYTEPDPDCDLDYVPNESRQVKVRNLLSNSLGFGGHNCTILLSQYEA